MKVTAGTWGKSIRELQAECKYCSGDETLFKSDPLWAGRTDSIEINIHGKSMKVNATADNGDYSALFQIKYCPMCGRRAGV